MQATVRPVVEVRTKHSSRTRRAPTPGREDAAVVRRAGVPVGTARALRDAVGALFGFQRW